MPKRIQTFTLSYDQYVMNHVVQSLSCVRLFATPWTAACQASLSLTISWSLAKFMCIETAVSFSYLILLPTSPIALRRTIEGQISDTSALFSVP